MPRKFPSPKVPSPFTEGTVGLAVKDGLREMRFNLKRGARKLVEGVQTATHGGDTHSHANPLGVLGEPLGLAVRTTAQLLRSADHVAVDLLSTDGSYRAMEVPLCNSADYFSGAQAADTVRPFTRDHHWRYRHWLTQQGRTDLFVHEQQIERAGLQVRQTLSTQTLLSSTDELRLSARVAIALAEARVLSPAVDADSSQDEESAHLAMRAAICVVLAGCIAEHCPGTVKEQTWSALQMADDACTAGSAVWERAVSNINQEAMLAEWMSFVVRHV